MAFYRGRQAIAPMNATARKMLIRWEYSGLENTAAVLMKANRIQYGFTTQSNLESYIRTLAFNYANRCESEGIVPTITGTGGWYVTFIPSDSDDYVYNVEVTLMSYVIAKYLELN